MVATADAEERGLTAPCWCGERKAYFALDFLDQGCGGTGVLQCDCGGDFCVCHWHGETECEGCQDCEYEDLDGSEDALDAAE